MTIQEEKRKELDKAFTAYLTELGYETFDTSAFDALVDNIPEVWEDFRPVKKIYCSQHHRTVTVLQEVESKLFVAQIKNKDGSVAKVQPVKIRDLLATTLKEAEDAIKKWDAELPNREYWRRSYQSPYWY